MNIMLVATNSDLFSGATRCLLEIAEGLTKHQIKVVVVIPRKGDIEIELRRLNIRYYYVHEYHSWYTSDEHNENNFFLKKILNYKSILKIVSIINREKIDLVHINALTAYTAAYAAVLTKKKLVWHIREFMEEDLNISFYNEKFSTSLINKSDRIIAISEPIRNKWTERFNSKFEVIPDGLPVSKYYISENDKKLGPTINIIIYGRIVEGKGQLTFFQAIKHLLENTNHNVHCYWAGKIEDTEYYHAIKKFIRESQLDCFTTYLGEISDVRDMLADKSITCVCSTKEAFGRVTIESMLSRTLVVGSKSGATEYLIEHKKNGLLFSPGNYMELSKRLDEAISNQELYNRMINSAQDYALKEYSLEGNISRIVDVYEDLLTEGRTN